MTPCLLDTRTGRHGRRILAWAALVAIVWGLGCGKKEPSTGGQPAPAPSVAPGGEPVWVRHITIQYVGAQGAPTSVKRTRAQADSLARELRRQLVQEGADFAALAKAHSDDASAAEGGQIAPLQPGDVPPEFERAAVALQAGAISDVVESPFGFHIIQRRSRDRVQVQHILVRYAGARNCPDSILRGRAEALAMAQRILAEVRNPDVSFPAAAYNYSEDEPTALRGGNIGFVLRGSMEPTFEQAAFALQIDEISDIVETPFGFHIIKRVEPMTIRVSHILVTYAGSEAAEGVFRTRDQALERAADVLFRARNGEDFAALAREFSDDPFTKKRGGRMARLDRGMMLPQFEEVAFSLTPGQISDIVETSAGFHIIKRHY
jgi:peptidyl-prolyl cis-trans isomerase SurA